MIVRLLLVLSFLFGATPALAAEPISGRRVTEEKDAIIEIASCGSRTCGQIVEFLVPPPNGVNQRDINNPDPKRKTRKLLGSSVLYNFSADGKRWRGRIYDPKSGKNYRSIVRRINATTLEVKGCLGPFCQTQTWKRAPN